MEGCLGLEVRLWLERPDIDDGAVQRVISRQIPIAVQESIYSLRSPLANSIQSLPLAPHVFRIRLVGLLSMVEGSVAVPCLVGVFFEESGRLRLELIVRTALYPTCIPCIAHETQVIRIE